MGRLNHIDAYIGDRVRRRRKELRLTQTKLGAALGVSQQQMRKYESGANRLAASQIHTLVRVLDIPCSYLFEQSVAEIVAVRNDNALNSPDTPKSQQLIEAFARIRQPVLQDAILDMVHSLASAETGKER